MADRHLRNPVTFRPPPDLYQWVVMYARATGQPVGAVITTALDAFRRTHTTDGENEDVSG